MQSDTTMIYHSLECLKWRERKKKTLASDNKVVEQLERSLAVDVKTLRQYLLKWNKWTDVIIMTSGVPGKWLWGGAGRDWYAEFANTFTMVNFKLPMV